MILGVASGCFTGLIEVVAAATTPCKPVATINRKTPKTLTINNTHSQKNTSHKKELCRQQCQPPQASHKATS